MSTVLLTVVLSLAVAPPKSEVEWLIEKLGDDNFDTRHDAQDSLFRMGDKAREALRRARKHEDVEIADRAHRILEKLGPGPLRRRIAGLIEKLGDKNQKARQEAAKALADIGPEAMRQLREARKHRDMEVRELARRLVQWLERGGK
jgi:HEAT repeat protein